MEPAAFTEFVAGIRAISTALGDGIKRPNPAEMRTAEVARRSVVAVRSIAAGNTITSADVAILRPGTGLPPAMLPVVIGSRACREILASAPITLDDLRG